MAAAPALPLARAGPSARLPLPVRLRQRNGRQSGAGCCVGAGSHWMLPEFADCSPMTGAFQKAFYALHPAQRKGHIACCHHPTLHSIPPSPPFSQVAEHWSCVHDLQAPHLRAEAMAAAACCAARSLARFSSSNLSRSLPSSATARRSSATCAMVASKGSAHGWKQGYLPTGCSLLLRVIPQLQPVCNALTAASAEQAQGSAQEPPMWRSLLLPITCAISQSALFPQATQPRLHPHLCSRRGHSCVQCSLAALPLPLLPRPPLLCRSRPLLCRRELGLVGLTPCRSTG